MGNKASRGVAVSLKDKDVKRLSGSTGFEADEVKALYGAFLCFKGEEIKSSDDLAVTHA